MQITLTHTSKTRTRVEAPGFCDVVNLDEEKNRRRIGNRIGVSPDWFLGRADGTHEVDAAVHAATLTVTVRPLASRDGGLTVTAEPERVLVDALSAKPDFVDPVVEWKDADTACFLDIDYHHVPRDSVPSPTRIRVLMAKVQPQPVLWFMSRSGGVHALYLRRDTLRANVLAAVAGFAFRCLEPTALFDLIPRSRLPSNEIHRTTATSDLATVRRFLSAEVDDSEVQQWFEERGVERGRAYDHSYCPAESQRDAKGKPVWFGDTGVRCQSCEAKGVCFGSRYPGYFPYAAVTGSHGVSEVATMVRNFTHWSHAEVVLEAKARLKGSHAKLCYEGMLRLIHGDDKRVDRVFRTGESLLRGCGRWVTTDRYETVTDCRATIAALPAVLSSEGKPIAERVDLFDNTVDLSRYGYVSIRPLYGMRVFGEYLGSDDGPVSVVLRPPLPAPLLPRYVDCSRRCDIETAWRRVESVFPGINRSYLTLLLAARGVAEGEIGIAPNILVVGPSSTGKTHTARIAASMLGDNVTEMQWKSDLDRFRQSYMRGANDGMYVVIDELFKSARSKRTTPRDAMDYFLNLTPGSVSHELYVGPVPVGRLPVTIVTDTSVPAEVRADAQVGRRFIYVRLDRRIEWDRTIVDSGADFRSSSLDAAEACNAIVSDVIDRFFKDRVLTLSDIATQLGYSTLEHCDEELDDPDAIPRLFTAVCNAPDAEDHRHTGRGWKRVEMGGETLIDKAWEAVCDGTLSYTSFCRSRRCDEVDLSLVLPVPIGTRLRVVRAANRGALIRFMLGRSGPVYYVNEELRTCEGERRAA